jgi:hypothetical protein
MSLRILFLFLIFIFCAGAASAQLRRHDPMEEDSNQTIEEMRARWEIKYAEKERLENLDRAREAAQLGSELYTTFSHTKTFSPTEKKKLDRLEKVTRKIRSQAGGSDGEVSIENMPSQTEPALKRLAGMTDDLRKAVEKTPRQVISAAVIERANEVLEVIRYIRNFTR